MSTASSSPERKTFPMTPESHRGVRRTAPTNSHPYAIKTTSTSVLSRSNSSGFVASHQHLYIPTTPSPSPSKHRHTKSDLTAARPSPRPLPIPPSFESPMKPTRKLVLDDQIFSQRVRADTLPPTSNPPLPSPVKVDDLPSNPRVWTTSQLASYLVTALRVRTGSTLPLPLPVAKDVASFVKQERLNGRAFLRLNEQDLEQMEINNLWRDALLNAARNLRANVLKGRIWGFNADEASDTAPIYPFRSRYNSSSSSIEDLSSSQDLTPQKDDPTKGRVRKAVASLERSSSSGSGFSNRGSSTSDGELAHGAFSEDEASFASGSEASDHETRRTRDMTKKRILPQPQALAQEIVVVAQTVEPSVEELLESEPLADSWGAKAWENMKAGDTMRYIGDEMPDVNGLPLQGTDDVASPVTAYDEANEVEFLTTGEAGTQIKDFFSKVLPARPLPSPPKSGATSPLPRRLITGLPVEIVERVDQAVQVDTVITPISAGPTDFGDMTITALDKDELKDALAQLDLYKKRLEEAEAKLLALKETHGGAVEYVSQAIETDEIPGFAASPSTDTDCEFPAGDDDGVAYINDDEIEADVVEEDRAISDWRGHMKRPDWDPLEKGVPTYVLMVGMGVCVVVLSTIVKRFVNRKA